LQTSQYTRKLAALLSADVVGYSRLMEDDDLSTVKTIKEYRTVIQRLVERYRGCVVDSPGDNILAQFASALDAVRCAIDIQEELKKRNQALPDPRKMAFRIGINVGEIIEEGGRIYGDGVNIAARIESLSEGGGICISSSAYEYVKTKLSILNEYIGEHSVKNIAEPIGVYRLFSDRVAQEKRSSGADKNEAPPKKLLKNSVAALVALVFAISAGIFIWNSMDTDMKAGGNDDSGPLFQMSFEDESFQALGWESNADDDDVISLSAVARNASDGSRSLRVTLPVIDFPGIHTCNLPRNWSGYRQLSADVFLDQSATGKERFAVRIDDVNSNSYYNRYNASFGIISGRNSIHIPIEKIATVIDISQITCLHLFLDTPAAPCILYFDNIRVE
jgi:class 3 adenylate cyclase